MNCQHTNKSPTVSENNSMKDLLCKSNDDVASTDDPHASGKDIYGQSFPENSQSLLLIISNAAGSMAINQPKQLELSDYLNDQDLLRELEKAVLMEMNEVFKPRRKLSEEQLQHENCKIANDHQQIVILNDEIFERRMQQKYLTEQLETQKYCLCGAPYRDNQAQILEDLHIDKERLEERLDRQTQLNQRKKQILQIISQTFLQKISKEQDLLVRMKEKRKMEIKSREIQAELNQTEDKIIQEKLKNKKLLKEVNSSAQKKQDSLPHQPQKQKKERNKSKIILLGMFLGWAVTNSLYSLRII